MRVYHAAGMDVEKLRPSVSAIIALAISERATSAINSTVERVRRPERFALRTCPRDETSRFLLDWL